jgi:hypothetical protein
MKKLKILFVVLMAGLFSFKVAQAQSVVKVNYLSIPLSTLNLAYENAFSDKASLQLQGYYWFGGSVGDVDYSGYGVTPEFRFYPQGKAPQGFFLAPYARYQDWSIKSEVTDETGTYTAKANSTSFGGGLCLGGQWIFGDLITLDVWGGPGYNFYNLNYEQGEEGDISPRGEGFTVRFGSTIGIKF